MRRILSLSSVIALTVMMSSFSYGQAGTVIEFSFEDRGTSAGSAPSNETFGSLIEDTLLSELPVTIGLNANTGNSFDSTSTFQGDARAEPLQISVIGGTGTGPGAHFNGSTSEFGVDSDGSDGDDSSAFDAALNESITIAFSEDLFLRELDTNSLFSTDQFSIQVEGSDAILIEIGDTSGFPGEFTFTGDTTPTGASGLFVAAGTGVEFRATNGSVGLDNLIVEIGPDPNPGDDDGEPTTAVPEPSSMLGLMGLAGLLAVKRRR